KGFIDRVRAMDRAQWDLAEAHLRNLHANSVVRKALLPRYRSALDAAAATARRLLRNGAERSGGQVVRMRPGRRLGVPAKPVGFVGWGTPEHAYSCNTQARSAEGPGVGGPHPGPPRSLLRGVDRRSRSGDTSSTAS
ncbi:MAG TPA: hypothetical protein VKK19_12875, partial [Candidatus Dormibacteraeota bacterium]|nr:hypothetical protein [Candidatus Dormibacteraeota bacterium]